MSSTQITHTHKIEFRILFKASLDLENVSKPRADGESDLIVEADISKVKQPSRYRERPKLFGFCPLA